MGLALGSVTTLPLQITFRRIDHSAAIESAIRRHAARLERFQDQITRCHVIVDIPHQHRHRGNHYAIRLEMTTPSGEVFVMRDPELDDSRSDFQTVLRDAFDAATRHLDSDAQRRQGNEAVAAQAPLGRVTQLFPESGYGFLETLSGEEVYFHQNTVKDGAFAQLAVGSPVHYTLAPEDGDHGARAASVRLLTL